MIATVSHTLFTAHCDDCGGDGPKAYDRALAQRCARDEGWAEESGRTRCKECRQKRAEARKK